MSDIRNSLHQIQRTTQIFSWVDRYFDNRNGFYTLRLIPRQALQNRFLKYCVNAIIMHYQEISDVSRTSADAAARCQRRFRTAYNIN